MLGFLARNSIGDSAFSSVGAATPVADIPGRVLGLLAAAGNRSVALTWLEPDDGGAAISEYQVQWRTGLQSFSSGRQRSVTNTSDTVPTLTNGTLYYFQVRAVNSRGNGNWAQEASATPQVSTPDQAIPDQAARPTGQAGNTQVTWVATPPSDNGADITQYYWQWREDGTTTWNTAATTLPVLTRTSLTNGTTYEARVRAENSVGAQTSWSPSEESTPQAEVPDQIQLIALDLGDGRITTDWGIPEANGSAIINYRLQWDDNSSFSSPQSVTITSTNRIVTGLLNGTTYYFRARAQNGAGNGAWSPTASDAPVDPGGRAQPHLCKLGPRQQAI